MIDVLVPCLGRPDSISRLKQNLSETTTVEAEFLFLVSPSDTAVISECVSEGVRYQQTRHRFAHHDYARKMNLGYRLTERPWILLGAQDIEFHDGWDTAALTCAERSGCRVVGTCDLGNRESMKFENFSTHPLVARSYVDEHGTIDDDGIVSEVYDHNWVDKELAETAAFRGEWIYCRKSIIKHLHPHWGYGDYDGTYKKGLRNFGADHKLFLSRRPLWGQPSHTKHWRRQRAR